MPWHDLIDCWGNMKREKTRHLVFVCFFSLSLVRLCYCRRCVASLRAYTFTNWNRLANVGHTPKPEPPSSLFLFSSLSLFRSLLSRRRWIRMEWRREEKWKRRRRRFHPLHSKLCRFFSSFCVSVYIVIWEPFTSRRPPPTRGSSFILLIIRLTCQLLSLSLSLYLMSFLHFSPRSSLPSI